MDPVIFRIILRWLLVALSLTGSFLIIKYFVEIFITKKDLKHKILKYSIVLLICGSSMFLYKKCTDPNFCKRTVHMKEDVLYILPKSDTTQK